MHLRLLAPALLVTCLIGTVAFMARAPHAQAAPDAGPSAAARPDPAQASDVLQLADGAAVLELVRIGVPERLPLPRSEVLSARMAYDEDTTARVGSAVSGRITALMVQAGDRVKVGQVLAMLDSPDASAALSDLEKARADERHKEAGWQRARALAAKDTLSQRELESAEADWRQALAERQRAELRVQSLHLGTNAPIGHAVAIRSPVNGVVMERNASPSQEVQGGAGTPLFVISDPRRLAVVADVPERLLGQVHRGDVLRVEVDAFEGEIFEARVQQVGPVLDANTRRIPVRALIHEVRARLMPEMYARAWVEDGKGAQALRVPNEALVTRGLQTCVFVEEAPGRLRLRRVELLQRGDAESFVGSGLRDGERVVTRGALLLNAELETQRDARP